MPTLYMYESYGSWPRESIDSQAAFGRREARIARALLPAALPVTAGLAAASLDALEHSSRSTGTRWSTGNWPRTCCCMGQFALWTARAANCIPTLIRLPGYPLFLSRSASGFLGWRIILRWRACRSRWIWRGACCWPILRGGWRRRAEPGSGAGDALAGSALPVYGIVCDQPAYRGADAVRDRAGAVVRWPGSRSSRDGGQALWFTFAVTCAAMLRPDGALAALAFAPGMVVGLRFGKGPGEIARQKLLRMAAGLRPAGDGSVCRVDGAQLADLSCISSRWRRGWPPIRESSPRGMRALGEELVPGFRLHVTTSIGMCRETSWT